MTDHLHQLTSAVPALTEEYRSHTAAQLWEAFSVEVTQTLSCIWVFDDPESDIPGEESTAAEMRRRLTTMAAIANQATGRAAGLETMLRDTDRTASYLRVATGDPPEAA